MSTDRGTDEGTGGVTDAAREREGRVRRRRSAAVAVPAVLAVGAMAVVVAQGALAASFAVSGTSFQVSSSKLSSKVLAS
ncbi:hypothetical protein ACFXGI_33870 [Streptomyces sp. NPDC059355]|uniref:hypothetical protein n=1 Tax=Streptomyces sp. NPDC059355 TaxID=3346811 RepID=UPI0036AEC325